MLAHVALAVAPLLAAATPTPHTLTALAPVEIWGQHLGDVRGLAADGAHRLWVADAAGGRLLRLDGPGSVRVVATGLRRPVGVAVDRAGRVLVVEEEAGRVVTVDAHGRVLAVVSGLRRPHWIAVGDDDTLYLSADPGGVLAVREGQAPVVVIEGLQQPAGVAVAGGALYVATRGRQPAEHDPIVRVPLSNASGLARVVELGDGSLRKPVGIAVDVLGTVFVTARRLLLPDDHVVGVVARLGADATADVFAAGADAPEGVAFDHGGNLYLADPAAGRVIRFAAPPAPAVDSVVGWTRAPTLTLTGTAELEARVQARHGGTAIEAPTGEAGRFTLALPLAPNAVNHVELRALAHDGAGLVSPPTFLDVVQDSQPPVVALDSPPTGAIVRGTVAIQATASDGGSTLAAVGLLVNGQPVAVTLAPALPAASAVARAAWQSPVGADGVYTLTARASDRAGNVTSVTRVVAVDNTPPRTSVSGPATLGDALRFAVGGVDNLTPSEQLVFAWRLDGGAWSPFAAVDSVAVPRPAPGVHVLAVKARDAAGNEAPVPATLAFTVAPPGLSLTITEPAAGARLAVGAVLVRGVLETTVADAGVAVNGAPAWLEGRAFTALVLVDTATSTLDARATTADGRTGQVSIPVAVSAADASPPALVATPRSGQAPLTVRLSLPRDPNIAAVELDADGDGIVDYRGDVLDTYVTVLARPGVYVARAVVTDTAGVRRTSTAVVQVFDTATVDSLLRARWSALKDALRRGDVGAGVQHIVERRRADYETAFGLMASELPRIDAVLTDIALVSLRNAAATYEMRRHDDGVERSFPVRFAVDVDGVWRLEAL